MRLTDITVERILVVDLCWGRRHRLDTLPAARLAVRFAFGLFMLAAADAHSEHVNKTQDPQSHLKHEFITKVRALRASANK